MTCTFATLAVAALGAPTALANPHTGQSVNVAIITATSVNQGGTFPTTTSGPTGSFTDFTFTNLSLANVNAANLAPFDSALLNVGGPGLNCSTGGLTGGQKTDLVNFVGAGKKLVISDSECSSVDYSWLPYPFTTSNPGAAGAQGTLSIVENSTLASDVAADSHFISEVALETGSDAVGDANVFTTFNPNWCVTATATNILGVNGPVLTYARFGSPGNLGLFVYNGLDQDFMSGSTAPNSAGGGSGNLSKLWLQALQTPIRATPAELPCGVSATGISLNPASATNNVGTTHTVTAHVTNNVGTPQPNTPVAFTVQSGPNAGATGTCTANANCTTDANGDVSFTYTGSGGAGTDNIQACFVQGASTVCSVVVQKTWVSPVTISINDVTVAEGDAGTTNANFTVSLSVVPTSQVTVAYATANGTATAGSDFQATAGTLTFPANGGTTQTVAVPVIGDTVNEPNETFLVNLSNPTNATIADGQGVGTIHDDDRNGRFSCRGSALRVGGTEPVIANPPNAPCQDDSETLLNVSVEASLLTSVRASTARADTDQTPNDLESTAPATSDTGIARAALENAALRVLGLPISATTLASQAQVRCAPAPGGGLAPVLTSSSTIAALRIGGTTVNVTGPITINLGVLTIAINQTSVTSNSITQRALVISGAGIPTIIVGEAIADFSGDPCAQ